MAQPGERGTRVSRRGVLGWILGGGLAAFLAGVFYPVARYILPPKQSEPKVASVVVGKVGDFPPNGWKIFRFGNKPGIILRTPDGDLRAFTAVCTHLGCTVQYREDFQHIWCACHNGHYDLHGKNISGPPPRPLTPFRVTVTDEGKIVVSHIPEEEA
ncbi:MAG: Rieske 2Fe-2S domain-containing protein [Calditrichaeota bacterium]|nr:Rieske 2Fe-2S domain-containing protein [Calditrichota bacterium]